MPPTVPCTPPKCDQIIVLTCLVNKNKSLNFVSIISDWFQSHDLHAPKVLSQNAIF